MRPDGTFRPLAWFESQHVERLFRAEVLRILVDKDLITEAVVDNLLSWHHSGFSLHGAVRVEDRAGTVRLGRYMIRCPIVLKRLCWERDTGEVVCRGRGAEMKILSFIVDFGAARATAKSLKLPAQEPEPLAHAPPETLEFIAEFA